VPHNDINGSAIDDTTDIMIVRGRNNIFRQSVNPVLTQKGIRGLHGLHPVPMLRHPPDAMHGGNRPDPSLTTLIRLMHAPDRISITLAKLHIPDITWIRLKQVTLPENISRTLQQLNKVHGKIQYDRKFHPHSTE
jgi:hypothetical protein